MVLSVASELACSDVNMCCPADPVRTGLIDWRQSLEIPCASARFLWVLSSVCGGGHPTIQFTLSVNAQLAVVD